MLSAVERGEKAPTIVVLDRIANGLGVALSQLLADDRRMIIRRTADQDLIEEPGGWKRAVLSPVIPGVNFEWIRSVLPAGVAPAAYPPYAAGSHEFIYVDEGALTLTVDGQVVRLEAGDSIYLAGDQELAYANRGSGECVYYVAALVMRPREPGLRWRA